jgi:hypothetical protein
MYVQVTAVAYYIRNILDIMNLKNIVSEVLATTVQTNSGRFSIASKQKQKHRKARFDK